MKKLFSILLAIFMLVSNTTGVAFANESVEFYAYTTDTTGFDEYAKEELNSHIYTYYGYVDSALKLGKGMNVFGKEIPTVLYPIWKKNEIVGTFNVIYYDGQYSGSYSEGNVEQLNHARKISTVDNPIKLVKTEDEFMYIINESAYDMTTGSGKKLEDVNTSTLSFDKVTKINIATTLEYNQMNTRAAASWNLSWNPSEHNGNSIIYCYAYALSPILRSLGYSTYTVSKITKAFDNDPGVDFDPLRNYLINEDFLCLSSSGGSMSSTNVVNWIYTNKKHILVGLEVLTESSTPKHFGTITGYSSTNGSYNYKIYDPQHNGINGLCTMPASTKTFTNSDNSTFVWNSGYITNIRK